MRSLARLLGAGAVAAVTAASVAALASPALASPALASPALASSAVASPAPAAVIPGARDAVFVQTDNLAGNQVVAYHRAPDGTLTQAGSYPTGGLGGQLAGSAVDHLASQGSLAYDPRHALLIAVNAGSSTVSVFGVAGDRLALRQVIASGGQFPVSVAVHGDLVYVASAEDGGSVQGFRVLGGALAPIPGSGRSLGLDPAATPQFTNTPGQVSFTPDGSRLIVTTKDNGNDIDVFGVRPDGLLTAPVVNSEPGAVPFGISFDAAGHVVIANSGPNTVATFALAADGRLTMLSQVATGQSATCWVVTADGRGFFAENAGSAAVSSIADGPGGTLTLDATTGTDPGTVDAALTPAGQFLYVQAGGPGAVDEFRVSAGGTLTSIGSVTVPAAAGGEGIVAP
jgi:6-phosphogluconolactonase (cycloisomerase 2 family)